MPYSSKQGRMPTKVIQRSSGSTRFNQSDDICPDGQDGVRGAGPPPQRVWKVGLHPEGVQKARHCAKEEYSQAL